jgi:hypothetical protein
MAMPPQLSTAAAALLVAAARRRLTTALGVQPGASDDAAADEAAMATLLETGASFVTLTYDGELRGCMGTLYPYRPLIEDVRQNVLHAALRDPRFPPVTAAELAEVSLEVTVLSPPQSIVFASEEEALAALRPHRDGIVFIFEGRRSTLLPQVWQSLPTAQRFLACLKQKAGLPPDFWHPAVRLERYDARSFGEVADQAAASKDSR